MLEITVDLESLESGSSLMPEISTTALRQKVLSSIKSEIRCWRVLLWVTFPALLCSSKEEIQQLRQRKSWAASGVWSELYTPLLCFPGGSEGKASACNAGDLGSIPGSGRSPGEGNGNPLQYSFLENPMDRGSWQTIVHRVTKSQTRLSDFTLLSLTSLYTQHLA